ncbi:hypothetical protein [Flavobacterium sp. T12S277]|uniref:hypothetical protein n=1 Tax=Flavobacterium sp. T12S277 TaxID=3402752 RepID=UPI003AEC4E00
MVKTIFLRQVLEEIKKTDSVGRAVPFEIEFRTYNKNNKMGGVLKKYSGAKLLIGVKMKGKPFVDINHFYRTVRTRKNPNHFKNRTRNIELPSGQIKKLNFLYITKFNGLQVIY